MGGARVTAFWRGRRVLVTGHTGFKGAWLCAWLRRMGAELCGVALPPEGARNLCVDAGIEAAILPHHIDIRHAAKLTRAVADFAPEVVFHLAAQSLVRKSYREPVETFETNVLGTINLLQAIRAAPSVRAAVIVTSDKCYENIEQPRAYRETDALGGTDPYSASKGCAEIATAAWRNSFLTGSGLAAVATARAGNVIGGGDWSEDRLVPDCILAWQAGRAAEIRHPRATRPWQHVLEPLHGYMLLAERLCTPGSAAARAWNFGPAHDDIWPVSRIADAMAARWGEPAQWVASEQPGVHEAGQLAVDSTLARTALGWRPVLTIRDALSWTVDWYRRYHDGAGAAALMDEQIAAFEQLREVPA
jgi:CDP-glucose 4,6-dehydratase